MSDLSIPGVASKIDTKSMIDALMEPDRVRLRRQAEEVDVLRDQKNVWQEVRGRLNQLDTAARGLYSFQNPFREKTATVGDPTALSATVTRDAARESHAFRVVQLARPDRFLSEPMDLGFQAPAGSYRFRVGEEEIRFDFKGGSLEELAETINRRAGKLLGARVIRNTANTRVFLLEGKKDGAGAAVELLDEAAAFGVKAGLLASAGRTLETPPLTSAVRPEGRPEGAEQTEIQLTPGASASLPFPAQPMPDTAVLEIRVRVTSIDQKAHEAPRPPQGPALAPSGRGTFQGHAVENEPSQFIMPRWEPPAAPKRVDDLAFAAIETGGRTAALPPLEAREGEQVVRVTVTDVAPGIDGLRFENRNTHREIVVSEVRLYDPTARGEYQPVNPLSRAQDAILEMDGIAVTRSSNQIDDLLTGVNITVLKQTESPVDLRIDTDKETIKSKLIEFVGYYNQTLTSIDILSRTDRQIVEDANYLGDQEREKALKQLGLLQGDLALNQLKNRLRQTIVTPYPTQLGPEMSMLVQVGIATDTGRPGATGTLSGTKLRGYLEIDEARLEEALARSPEAVAELFGSDTDRDFVIDSGVGFAISRDVRPFIQTGGLIAGRVGNIDTTVSRRERDIATANRQLEEKEERLRRDYTMMEGMLNTLERSSQAIENFNQSTGANQR